MGIEIYSKAVIVKKEDKYYYLLKHHSKNDAVCRGQTIVDANFNNKYLRREGRGGTWSVKAHGTIAQVLTDEIAITNWNAPTSWVYGQIQFGNKKNIALYWAKQGQKGKFVDFETLTEQQQDNVSEIIKYYMLDSYAKYRIDLAKVPEEKRLKTEHSYCDEKKFLLEDHCVRFHGRDYWNLDNL